MSRSSLLPRTTSACTQFRASHLKLICKNFELTNAAVNDPFYGSSEEPLEVWRAIKAASRCWRGLEKMVSRQGIHVNVKVVRWRAILSE